MIVSHISVDYSQKVNLGNFESVSISLNIHGKPEDGEDADACYELLMAQAQQVVMAKLREVTEAHDVTCLSITKYFAGKEINEFPSSFKFSEPYTY